MIFLKVVIHKNSGTNNIYENIQHISTGINFIDGKPVYILTLNAYPKFIDIRLEDIKSYEVYHTELSVVEVNDKLQCPHCCTMFDKSILDTTEQFLSFCPNCGNKVRFVLPTRTEEN